jgi:hypothetical protein
MPRKSLPSTAPGGPSTGVVGTPLTSVPSKQALAERKRAKDPTISTAASTIQDTHRTCLPESPANHAQSHPA